MTQRFPRFELSNRLSPRYNVAPQQRVVGVCNDTPAQLQTMRWGLVPPWVRDENMGFNTINARAETVAEKPMYRAAFRNRRCLVFADGFYEWRKTSSGKQPVRFTLRSGDPFAFAGIYEDRVGIDGEPLRTCSIITAEPNAVVEPVHDRMPVLLPESEFDLWLDRDVNDAELLRTLLRPYPAAEMTAYDVTPLVNNAKNEGAALIEPYAAPQEMQLL